MEIIKKYLAQANYSGVLVYGPHIDETIEIFGKILLIPLKSLYYNNYIEYIKDFFLTFEYKYADYNIDTFIKDYSDNIPVCYIIIKSENLNCEISEFDKHFQGLIDNAKLFLSLISGQSAHEFFKVAKINGKIFYKTELTQFNKVHRLWLSNEEKSIFIANTEKTIENQRFSISLFHDANKEINHIYKIARYFMVLESITGSNSESRKHIKSFFSSNDYSWSMNHTNTIENYSQNIDAIEIAGIIRAKLFHGVQLKYEYFKNKISVADYEIIMNSPEHLSRHMRDLCETAFFMKNSQNNETQLDKTEPPSA